MENYPLVSVIMPVYDAEAYLAEAIDSMLEQTYENWELILVDDGSKDRSSAICDEYALRDPRIRVMHQQNQGASAARNAGIELARGEWIQFFDDDDILLPHAVQTLVKHSEQTDMVVCAYEEFPKRIIRRCTDDVRDYASMDEMAEDFLILRRNGFFNPQWNKLYRRDCLGARFEPAMDGSEDVFFSLSYLPRCKTVRVIPDVLIRYRLLANRASLGNKFIAHFPRITEKTWYAFYDAFQGKETVMHVISRDLAVQLMMWTLMLFRQENLSRKSKHILLDTYLGEALNCKKNLKIHGLPLRRRMLWYAIQTGKSWIIELAVKLYR